MNDEVKRLERRVRELTERLRRVEEYLFEVEDRPYRPETRQEAPKDPEAAVTPAEETSPATTIVSLIGRSLIVLGGAFLLRWLTQSGFLPQEIGSVIGMVYALVWIAMADISAGKGQRHSAAFHGVTGAMIALPLLVEATSKLHFLSPAASAASLAAFVILGLVVAGRRRLRILAWIVAVPAAPVAFLLAIQTKVLTPFLLSLLVLGFVTLWLGYLRRWQVLATIMAGAANIGMMFLVLDHDRNARATGVLEMGLWEVLLLLIGLIAVYFGSFCFRMFKRKRTITALEIGQTLTVVFIGLGGTAVAVNAREQSMLPLGIVCFVLSVACYGAAYGFLPRLDPNRRNFLFFTLIGLAMLLLGCELVFERPVAAVIFAVTGLIAGVMAKPIASPVLYLHGTVYVFAAIVRSGLLATTTGGFIGPLLPTAEWAAVPILSTLAVTISYPWLPRPEGRAVDVFLGRRGVELLAFVAILALGIAAVALITRWLPLPEAEDAYRGALATVRTAVLALSAAALAAGSRRARYHYMAWPVYMLLALGALKIVLEDIRAGGSAIMFLAFGLYGSVLILAPRLLRKAGHRRSRSVQADPPPQAE
jgi:hypothetical protein